MKQIMKSFTASLYCSLGRSYSILKQNENLAEKSRILFGIVNLLEKECLISRISQTLNRQIKIYLE